MKVRIKVDDKQIQESDSISGSITPGVHQERAFALSLEDSIFKDKYVFSTEKEIIRFGINEQALTNRFFESDASVDASPDESVRSERTAASTKRLKEEAEKVVHEPEEVEVLKSALSYLMSDESCRVVLMDFIERKNSIFARDEKTGLLKTHTVVLYKNPSRDSSELKEIVVIDPNNPNFSVHLSNASLIESAGFSEICRIITFPQKNPKKIYVLPEDAETGFGDGLYRDCVDISLKIAHGLCADEIFDIYSSITLSSVLKKYLPAPEEAASASAASSLTSSSDYYKIEEYNDIINCPVIRVIQKGERIDDNNWYIRSALPVRILQSVEPILATKFYLIAKKIDSLLTSFCYINSKDELKVTEVLDLRLGSSLHEESLSIYESILGDIKKFTTGEIDE
jgi:hypothetical protein